MAFVAPLIASVALHPIAAAAVGGAAFFGAKSLLGGLGGSTPSAPAAPASASSSSAAEIQNQADITAQKNALDLARRKRTGTTLTSNQGLLSTEQTNQKTLLGG